MTVRDSLLTVGILTALVVVCVIAGMFLPGINREVYKNSADSLAAVATSSIAVKDAVVQAQPVVQAQSSATHLPPPAAIKGIYMTSWVAGSPNLREPIIKLASATGVNAIVIDVKDYSGYLSFVPNDPSLLALGAYQNRISDIDALIAELHSRGFYVIGRVVTFQDPVIAEKHPAWAVQNGPFTKNKAGVRIANASDIIGTPWKDNAGLMWVDPGASGNWQYLAEIGKEAYSRGFDEINFDYVRFPSDGDVNDAIFPASGTSSPPVVLTGFFQYISGALRGYVGAGSVASSQPGLKISADLFGMTTTASDDMGIGQVIDDALPYFDYIDPMVYPSHFSAGWDGFAVPDSHPYQVISAAMDSAVTRAEDLANGIISTTTPSGVHRTTSVISSIEAIPLADRLKVTTAELRPWLQDFELHYVPYTPAMVGEEIQATNDAGLHSWLVWDPSNKYISTFAELKLE